MNEQRSLFDFEASSVKLVGTSVPSMDHYEAAMICSAMGDALGWPTELLRKGRDQRVPFHLPLREFTKWDKLVGGRWWGYRDEINPGEYSDDTQLTLAVARSLSSSGEFEPERFAYLEFPLWLHYERGGGRSIKTAARNLVRYGRNWLINFYKQGSADYLQAGANGAAMRNLPIALVSFSNERRLIRDSFFNAIISHGHPRAILGTILYGLAIRYALTETALTPSRVIERIKDELEDAYKCIVQDQWDGRIARWIADWDKRSKTRFRVVFSSALQEAHHYLAPIPRYHTKTIDSYYEYVGAYNPLTKGSGLSTVSAAIYLFLRFVDAPPEAIFAAANQIGSDTDTIASFVGGLVGARFGKEAIPKSLEAELQDRDYIAKMGAYLHAIAAGQVNDNIAFIDTRIEREEAFMRILAWEIGLHNMFWDAIKEGGKIFHPTLGRGVIREKKVRKIARKGYIVKLIRVQFDSGQSTIFHSRVREEDGNLSESLGQDMESSKNI